MAKKVVKKAVKQVRGGFRKLVSAVMWIVGVLVALAVGFGMADGALSVRFIPAVITQIAGWIVVIMTLLGIVLAIIDAIK